MSIYRNSILLFFNFFNQRIFFTNTDLCKVIRETHPGGEPGVFGRELSPGGPFRLRGCYCARSGGRGNRVPADFVHRPPHLGEKVFGFRLGLSNRRNHRVGGGAYIIVIQAGAIAAVIFLYWSKIVMVFMGIRGKSREGLMLGRNLLVAFIPAVVIGLTIEDLIDKYLFNHWPVLVALVAGAALMLAMESWRLRRKSSGYGDPETDLHELTIRQSLLIGLLQCVAMWPGTSRSMMVIVGGYMAGLSPRRAAEFSFLLGLPTLGGAAFYKGLKYGPEIMADLGWAPMTLGFVVAAVSAAISVKWLVGYLGRHGLALFAWYRIALAVLMGFLIY